MADKPPVIQAKHPGPKSAPSAEQRHAQAMKRGPEPLTLAKPALRPAKT